MILRAGDEPVVPAADPKRQPEAPARTDLSIQEEMLLASLARLDSKISSLPPAPALPEHTAPSVGHSPPSSEGLGSARTGSARFAREAPKPRKPKPVMFRIVPPRPSTQQRRAHQRREEILHSDVADARDALLAMVEANRTKRKEPADPVVTVVAPRGYAESSGRPAGR